MALKVVCVNNEGVNTSLTKGKVYTVLSADNGWYQVIDDTGHEDFFHHTRFEFAK